MGRSNRRITILGKGFLGSYLCEFIREKKFQLVKIISIRENSNINNILKEIDVGEVIIDCMDRNIHDKDENRLDFINKLREEISKINNILYIYISSTNIYCDSYEEISEDSELIKSIDSNYETYKIKVEKYLQILFNKENLLISRLPSLWDKDIKPGNFMGDLINSYKNKIILPSRSDDEKIMSYINIENASEIIYFLYQKGFFGVHNITTNDWCTRKDLKFKNRTISYNYLGKKIISEKYDYKKLISKKISLQ